MAVEADGPINIMVVGECGDGKSTLINGLRDHSKSEAALCGKNLEGVTKSIMMYPCHDIDGRSLNLLDTPGVGDHGLTTAALIGMIEEFLETGSIPGGVRGVVVTTRVPDGRLRLGAQIVQAIVDKGFVAPAGADKYGNIILCGTKVDKADRDDMTNFMEGLHGQCSVKQLFFENSVKQTGPCVMVSHNDYKPLLEEIQKLPNVAITYTQPESKEMATTLAETCGMQPEALRGDIEEMRDIVARNCQQLNDLQQQALEDQKRYHEELAKRDEMIRVMASERQDAKQEAERARLQRQAEIDAWQRERDAEHLRAQEEA